MQQRVHWLWGRPRHQKFELHSRFFVEWEDVNWMNAFQKKKGRGLFNFFFKILIFFILVFLSTPATVLNIIKQNNIIDTTVLTGGDGKPESGNFLDYLLKSFLPPLIIILINRLLLLLITQLSWITSAVGESGPLFLLPEEHPQPRLFLHLLQHRDRAGTRRARWDQHL